MDNDLHGEKSLAETGSKLWRAVTDDYELDAHEELLLLEACRTADVLHSLSELVETEGLLDASSQGRRAHPAVTEARQQRIVLARLLAALQLPVGEDDADGDSSPSPPRRRGGPRGAYRPRGVA